MRRLLLLATMVGLPAVALADDSAAVSDQTTTVMKESAARKVPVPDRLLMSDGSVVAIRGSQGERLTNDVQLPDGTVVTPGGTVRRLDGAETRLSDGQSVSREGRIIPAPARATTTETTVETGPTLPRR